MSPARRRALLGRAIAFIPQAPMTALNPVITIGAQFDEHLARLWRRCRKGRRERQSPRRRSKVARDPPKFSPNTRINCRAACVSAC